MDLPFSYVEKPKKITRREYTTLSLTLGAIKSLKENWMNQSFSSILEASLKSSKGQKNALLLGV